MEGNLKIILSVFPAGRMVRVIYGVVFIFAFFRHVKCECFDLEVHVTQKIDNEGFHRDFGWLIEGTAPSKEEWVQSGCKLALRAEMTPGMFVNPDQVAELNRTNEVQNFLLFVAKTDN